ncbi:hypothetical protein ACSBR1_002016 [Camellia fascicularis]
MEEEDDKTYARKLFFLVITITTIIIIPFSSASSTISVSSATSSLSTITTTQDESSAMSKLAKSLSPTPSGWSSTSDHCDWSGISCDSSGHVTSISLASKSLSGKLPSELNYLSHLKSISLQRNHLSGSFPSLSNLASLQQVFLDNNNFTSIPSQFLSGLTTLQTLSIGNNPNLPAWTLPETLSDSTTLNTLYAPQSNLIGTMPDIFQSFPNLQNLRLSYNNLTGPLPPSFAKSGIQNLWLNNQELGLSGRIDVLGSMTQLTQVWLHQNQFSGPIPDLSGCTSLFDLSLRDNDLTGPVLPSLTTLPNLVNVSLQNNKLQGPVPSFGKGVVVNLGQTNNFCNSKPGPCDPQVTTLLEIVGALGYPMALAESWSGNDPCKGWISISCDSRGSVAVLNFGKQGWSGTISPAIANLTTLTSLLLNDNDLTGPIPSSLTKLALLRLLDVSNNNISGQVPKFGSGVKVKISGNPLLGKDVHAGDGSGSGSSSNSSSSSSPSGSSSSGRTNDTNNGMIGTNGTNGSSSGSGTPVVETQNSSSSTSLWVIVAAIVAALIFIVGLSLVVYRMLVTKRKLVEGSIKANKKLKNGGANGVVNGFGSELPSQGSADNNDIHVYDGGNVTIPIEVLREVTNNFSEDNILGQGGFGVVYKGKFQDGTQIAVKRMEATMASSKGLSEFQAEIAVLTKVRHRHLVALIGFCVNGSERLLVYEYMPQGTLGQHLFNCKELGFSPLTWKERVTVALDVARGVEYLHSLAQQSFIHRDLKPSNILLGDDMRAKVSDFGLVKNAPDGKYSVETRLAGTFGYLAPEYAATGKVTTKVDVFAFGVVLMEMITGRKALDESLPEEKSHLVTWFRRIIINKDNIRKSIDPSLDPDEETYESIIKVTELAGHCTAREPFQRPDMGHAVTVLSPLVDEWKPTNPDEEDSFGIDFHTSLPQVLQLWQAGEGTSTMTSDYYNGGYTSSSTPNKPSGFASSFSSKDGR